MREMYRTTVTVNANIDTLVELRDRLEDALAETICEPNWLGNLWVDLGLDAEDAYAGKLGHCDGEVASFAIEDGRLVIVIRANDRPAIDPVEDFVTEYAPYAELHHVSHPIER